MLEVMERQRKYMGFSLKVRMVLVVSLVVCLEKKVVVVEERQMDDRGEGEGEQMKKTRGVRLTYG